MQLLLHRKSRVKLQCKVGGRPVSLEDLRKCCGSYRFGSFLRIKYQLVVLGVDWGFASTNSLTVVTVIGKNFSGKFEVLFAKKYHYRDRVEQIKEITQIYRDYGAQAIGVDHGVGLTDNFMLRHNLGSSKVWEYHYCNPKVIIRFLPEKMLHSLNRTASLNLLFTSLKNQDIIFPVFEQAEPFFEDILSIREDVRRTPHGDSKYYDRNPNIPDDFVHSLNFAVVTGRLLSGDPIFKSALR